MFWGQDLYTLVKPRHKIASFRIPISSMLATVLVKAYSTINLLKLSQWIDYPHNDYLSDKEFFTCITWPFWSNYSANYDFVNLPELRGITSSLFLFQSCIHYMLIFRSPSNNSLKFEQFSLALVGQLNFKYSTLYFIHLTTISIIIS